MCSAAPVIPKLTFAFRYEVLSVFNQNSPHQQGFRFLEGAAGDLVEQRYLQIFGKENSC